MRRHRNPLALAKRLAPAPSSGILSSVEVVIVNHGDLQGTRRLKEAFQPHIPVYTIDSGSPDPHGLEFFDLRLPNVYYGGLIRTVANRVDSRPPEDWILFICSDVRVPTPKLAVRRLEVAFADPSVLVVAPACPQTGHPQMKPLRKNCLRPVPFVEGFCFAARIPIWHRLQDFALEENPIGWGIDKLFGYLALKAGGCSAVDHGWEVEHTGTSGYDTRRARHMMEAWVELLCPEVRAFFRWTHYAPLKQSLAFPLYRWRFPPNASARS